MSNISLTTNSCENVHSFQLNSHQKVVIKYEQQAKENTFYLEDLGQRPFIRKIHDVIMPDGLKELLSNSNNPLFSCLYPRVVGLRDGTLKLYLNFRILGGMVNDEDERRSINIIDILEKTPNVKNTTIADIIIFNLPADTYSVVNVSSIKYSFAGMASVNTRCIELVPAVSNIRAFLQNLRRFFAGYQYANRMTINGTALSEYILGLDNSPETIEKAEEQIIAAWSDKRRIRIYVSQDGTSFEARLEDAKGGCVIS
ncbi:MAG: hypothetical protein KBA81_07280 [Rhabdochlamydiaceae bacterium]|nr:hypothetical protein [Rhabdochlamydiaceae bacterium]